jgi:hypothetical protein
LNVHVLLIIMKINTLSKIKRHFYWKQIRPNRAHVSKNTKSSKRVGFLLSTPLLIRYMYFIFLVSNFFFFILYITKYKNIYNEVNIWMVKYMYGPKKSPLCTLIIFSKF